MRNVKISKVKKMIRMIEKMTGLMFSKKVSTPLFFVFERETSQPFHSFFCPDFDIVFLDKNYNVNEFYKIRNWKVIRPKIVYKYVLEAEPGFIARRRIKKGDRIKIC